MGDILEDYRRIKAEYDASTGSFSRDVNVESDQAATPTWANQNPDPTYDDPEEQAVMSSRKRYPENPTLDLYSYFQAEESIRDLRKQKSAAIGQKNLEARNPFMRGLYRGFDTLQGTYQGGLGMLSSLAGDETSAQQRFQAYQDEMRQASENPRDNIDFFSTDAETGAFGSLSNFGTYAAGTLGEAVPSLAESVLTGIAGAALGAAVVPAPDPFDVATVPVGAVGGVLAKGAIKKAISNAAAEYVKQGVVAESAEQLARQYVGREVARRVGSAAATTAVTGLQEGGGMYMEGREAGYDSPGTALGLGLASGLSESLLGAAPGVLKSFAGRSGVDEIARREGWRAAAGYLWDTVKASGEEGVQEGFQEFLGSLNKEINDPNSDLFNKENFMQWAEAAAGGALVGGAVKSGTTGVELVGLRGGRGGRRGADPADDPFIPQLPPGADTSEDLSNVQAKRELLERVVDEVNAGQRETFPRELAKDMGLIGPKEKSTSDSRLQRAEAEIARLRELENNFLAPPAQEATAQPPAEQIPPVAPPPSDAFEETPAPEPNAQQQAPVDPFNEEALINDEEVARQAAMEMERMRSEAAQPAVPPSDQQLPVAQPEAIPLSTDPFPPASEQVVPPAAQQPPVSQPEVIPPSTNPFDVPLRQAPQEVQVQQPQAETAISDYSVQPTKTEGTNPFEVVAATPLPAKKISYRKQQAPPPPQSIDPFTVQNPIEPTPVDAVSVGAQGEEVSDAQGTRKGGGPNVEVQTEGGQSPFEGQVIPQGEQAADQTPSSVSFSDSVDDWDEGRRQAARNALRRISMESPSISKIKGRNPTVKELSEEIDKWETKSKASRVDDGINWPDVRAYAESKFGQSDGGKSANVSPAFSPTEQYTKLPEKSREKFEAAWDGSDPQAMKTLVHGDNKVLRAEFENRTGEKLPRTVKGTNEIVDRVYRGRVQRETITPANDKPVGKNAAGEQLYEREDGSRYRMRMDRKDRPDGYPDFGGDLSDAAEGRRYAAIYDAIVENGGYENNSADDVEAIRRKLYDGENTPTHADIRSVMQDMKNEAGRKSILDEDQLPPSAIQHMMQGDRLKGEMWRSPTVGGQSGKYGAFYATNEEGAGKYSRGVGINVAVTQMVELNNPLVVDTKQQAMEELRIDEDSLQEPSETQDIHHYIDIAIFEEASRERYDGVVYKQEGYAGNPVEVHVFNPPDIGELPSFTVQGKKQDLDPKAADDKPKPRAGNERSVPLYRDWRFSSTARNAGKIVPNKVGAKFLPDQMQAIVSWAKSEGYSVSDVSPTGIRVSDQSGKRLDIAMAGAAGVKAEESKAASARREEKQRQADADRKSRADSRESAAWIANTFGDVMNDYNRNALSDYVEGVTNKYEGQVAVTWREPLEKLGALSPDGKVDWEKIKQSYAASKDTTKAAATVETEPTRSEFVDAALKALDAILESERPAAPAKRGRKEPKVTPPERTRLGQYTLPGMPGMAAEIDRQDFIRRYRDQVFEDIRAWSSDPADADEIQDAIDSLAPPMSEMFSELYNGKYAEPEQAYDYEPHEKITKIAGRFPFDGLILNSIDDSLAKAIKARPSTEDLSAAKKAPKSTGRKPRKSQQTLADAKSDRQAARDAAASLMKKIDGKLMSGVDPQLMAEAIQVAYMYVKADVKTFKGYVEAVIEDFSEAFAKKLAPYMEAGWEALNIRGLVNDPVGKVEDYLTNDDQGRVVTDETSADNYGTPESPNRIALGRHFYSRLKAGASYPRITDARREVSELVGGPLKDGSSAIKDVDEAVELGVVMAARDIVQSGMSDDMTYEQLVDLYDRQPNLANRNSTSMREQAYSTPAPLAFLVNKRAGVSVEDTVYDSSAGNGMLLIVGGERYANELNKDRAAALRSQGIDTNQGDATSYTSPKPFDALVINPPFSEVKDESGKPIIWELEGIRTDKIDHAITIQSLANMPTGSKAAIIIAAKGFEKSEPKSNSDRGAAYRNEKRFYNYVYDNYNVTDHFTVHGDLYRRQGASFPVDVIIIEGKGKSQRPKPYNIVGGGIPEVFRTWEDLKDAKLRPVSSVSSTSTGRDEATDSAPVDGGNEAAVEGDAETLSPRLTGERVGGKDRGEPNPERLGGVDGQSGTANETDAKATVDGGTARSERGGRDSGRGYAGGSDRSDSRVGLKPDETAETDHQVSYSPGSGNQSVDTLIPRNHQAAVAKSLDAVAEIYGDIDKFVASELGYDMDEFRDVFSAEQVDALALAIARHKDGGAFIIGDQTGVGKGRAAAAMMVYANRNGMVPVFITEKPTLYADMVRDLIDIRRSTEESPFNILMTNSLSGKDVIPLPDGRVLKQSSNAAKENLSKAVASVLNGNMLSVEAKTRKSGKNNAGSEPTVYNAVFTTYSQMQPVRQLTPERAIQLKRISSKSFFVLDESHNAGGTGDSDQDQQGGRSGGQDATITRAEIVRDLIGDAAGVYFSSATYAKRPQTMGLYARTGMTAATNGDPNALAEAIATGGVPLQQVVSEQLVESGMYLRRERSFDGVDFNPKTVDVDLANLDNVASIFSAINFFDNYAQEAIQELSDEVTSSGGSIAETEATGQAGLESTSFASILHNLVDQMLLAVKADAVANETIESIKNGEAPVIYVDSTFEAALKRQVEEVGASQGDEIDFSYKDLVRRYLERSREYTTRTDADDPDSVVRIRLTDAQLGPAGVAAYERALGMIDGFKGNMPASPIDWIRKRVTDAGYSISEITGRQVILDYGDDEKVRLGKRPDDEEGAGGRTKTVSRFNNGELDAVLINQSGSTGISMHSSEKFANKKPRHMIIGQPARNIDTFMQSLGRVHRTGQVVLPRFTLLMTNAPAEIRPASVLMKKLSSLNANVTASAKGAVSFDAPDVINVIGDQVVAEYLADNLPLDQALGEIVQLRRDGTPKRNPGIAKKASGRMALRPVAEQKDFWDSVIASYDELIEELNRVGKNPLVASTIDLKAKTIESVTIFDGDEGSSNLFMHPASVETVTANKPGKPMTADEVVAAVSNFYGNPASQSAVDEWVASTREEVAAAYQDYVSMMTKDLSGEDLQHVLMTYQLTGSRQLENLMARIASFAPGNSVSVHERAADGSLLEVIPGYVTKVKRLKGGNPLSASKWVADIAIASPDRIAKAALSRTGEQDPDSAVGRGGTYLEFRSNNELLSDVGLREFEESDLSATETRYIGVGNILAAYSQLGKAGGQITFFTDSNGEIRRGVLMPRSFRIDRWNEARPVVLDDVDQAHQFLSQGGQLITPDRVLALMMVRGELIARAPKAKSRSGKYTINSTILRAASPHEFGSIGSRMEMAIPELDRQKSVLSAIMSIASLQAIGTDKNLARRVKESTPSKSQKKLGDKLDELDDTLMQTTPDAINREMLLQATELAIAAEKAGIDVYDRLVAFAVKKIGEERTRAIGAYLYHAGNAAGMKGVRPTRDVLGTPGVTREQAVAFAKAAFGETLTDEQIEAGISLQDITAFGRDEIGFAPFGSPVPRQSLMQTKTPAFQKWFGDSKVVDENGNPLVMYHGTDKDFDVFENRGGKVTVLFSTFDVDRKGFFFAQDKSLAFEYGDKLVPVYLSIQNPANFLDSKEWPKIRQGLVDKGWNEKYLNRTDAWELFDVDDVNDGARLITDLKSMGYDGAIIEEPAFKDENGKYGVSHVAFDNTQIKSARSNSGTFDPSNPSILMQNQGQGDNVKGWTTFITATRAIIGATDKADVSTFIHEFFHPMRRFLLDRNIPQDKRAGITDADIMALEKYAGVKDGDWEFSYIEDRVARRQAAVMAEEKAAKAWEQYWFEGKSPNAALEGLFEKIARWMRGVYKSINEITGGKLPQEVRDLFDKIVQRGGGIPVGNDTAQPDNSRGEPLTSIKNAVAEEIAVRRQAIHIWDAATETSDEWLEDADRMLRSDPYIAQRIVREMIDEKPRNLSNTEVAILQIHYRHINNLFENASDRMFSAHDKGDIVEKARLRVEVDALGEMLWDIEEAAKAAGREWGRAGVARQIVLRKDFSRAAMLRRARVANGGNPLNEEQTEAIEKLAKQVADLEGKLAKSEQEKTDLERQLRAEKDINEEKKRASGTSRKSESKNQAASKLQDFAKKFANIFGFKQSDPDTLQQTEDERMLEEAGPVVQAYVDAGVFSFGELLANIERDLGSDLPMQARVAFSAAWKNLKDQGDIPTPTVDASNSTSLTRLARRILRALVEAGITDRDEVVDAVQESLREMDIELTKRETMDAMSGYGQFTSLPDDETSKIIRDINGQLQQIAKLQDMGYELIGEEWVKVRDGVAPSKTGGERRTPTDEERELIRQVNEAKRRGGYKITDPESQLRSAVDAAKRAAANRIYDLQKALREGKPIVGNKTSLAGQDADLDEMRKELAEWTEKYRDMFPKPEATMEQRIAATNRVLDAEIAAIRRQLLSGDVMPKGRKDPVSTPEIEAKRARLEALRAQRETLQLMLNPNMKNEQAAKAYMAALLKQIADYQERLAKNDFDPKPKKPLRILTKEELLLKNQLEDVKDQFFRKAADYRLANMSPGEKAWDYTKEWSHLSRALMTSFDLSAVFRQGGVASFSHPKLATQVGRDMLKALRSKQSEFDIAERIRNHPLYQFAMTAKLAITEDEARITKQEEAFMGRWVRWGIGKEGSTVNKLSKAALLPVRASGRAYTTYLNGMRFELFKLMVDGLGGTGRVTADEAKIIAQYVNVATGRADLGKFNQAAANMSVVFFAPRYVASRFQYLAMPFYLLPSSKISGRVKKAIAMEYARYISSVSLFLGSTVVFGGLLAGDDDDEQPKVELDPRSTDFLKIRIGETRIDPMAGFSQIATFTTQVLSGQRKKQDGEVRDMRGENLKWGDKTTWDVMADFARKKLAPVPGAAVDLVSGENVIGEKETPLTVATGLFVPLSWGEVKESMQSRGIPTGTAISALALLGMGGGTYGPKTQYANGTEEQRKKQLEKDIKEMEFDSPDPAYSEFLTEKQIEQVKARREERRQDLAYAASASPNRKDYQSDENYKKAIADRDKAMGKIRESGIGPNELRSLLLAYWKRTNNSPYELRGGVFQLKKPVQDRIRQIRRQFSNN